MREFTGLVREDGVMSAVYVGEHITDFAAFELGRLEFFKRNGLGLG